MVGLYERFLEMSKEAQVVEQTTQVDEARVNVIREKVAQAEALIKQAGVTEYDTQDLAEVTEMLINDDIEAEESTAKIAELYDMGQIMMEGFYAKGREIAATENQ